MDEELKKYNEGLVRLFRDCISACQSQVSMRLLNGFVDSAKDWAETVIHLEGLRDEALRGKLVVKKPDPAAPAEQSSASGGEVES